MILDLHNHTRNSHDGFTTSDELIAACKIRGIDAVAVTEHDALCELDPAPFAAEGIELIPGCEFTDSNGAHIVGLFVRTSLPVGTSAARILDHISTDDGFAVMPHPWKPGSGFMACGGDQQLVARFTFIELINGGWPSPVNASDIRQLAGEFDLRMIAASDSHKACQVGLCCIRIPAADAAKGARRALAGARQADIELLVDRTSLARHGRRSSRLQQSSSYQALLPLIPTKVRRAIKVIRYQSGPARFACRPNFEIVSQDLSSW